mmetsp:Transcript_36391/g.145414  ORF Transcript_36391/g.145414 Transcript_36391/m.145414 type:complete len:105 (+) Transcript_36391:192-506(+)
MAEYEDGEAEVADSTVVRVDEGSAPDEVPVPGADVASVPGDDVPERPEIIDGSHNEVKPVFKRAPPMPAVPENLKVSQQALLGRQMGKQLKAARRRIGGRVARS